MRAFQAQFLWYLEDIPIPPQPMRQLLRINAAILFLSTIATGQTVTPAHERKVALILGNDSYRYVTHLKTAANDARGMQAILHDRYGFETTLLTDATRAQITAALSSYRRTLGPESSLLIYYAGHGYADPAWTRVIGGPSTRSRRTIRNGSAPTTSRRA